MTLNGAIMQLVEMRENSMMPVVFKPYFDKVIETISECVEPSEIPHWIPCSEMLPEDGRYLVTRDDFVTNTYFLDVLWYEKGVWWNRLYTGDFSVIAWMPLPECYRGKQDGKIT